MSVQDTISKDELALVEAFNIPRLDKGNVHIDLMDAITDHMLESSNPFVSVALARIVDFLFEEPQWYGNEDFSSHWSEDGLSRTCTFTRNEDGQSWVVSIGGAAPRIELSVVDEDGTARRIATGSMTPGSQRPDGTINQTISGRLSQGAFDDLKAVCDCLKPLLKADVTEIPYARIDPVHKVKLKMFLEPVIMADGGLPGRLCGVHQRLGEERTAKGFFEWLQPLLPEFADGLRRKGAIWGNACMSYNDGDNYCSVVDFSDGSNGLYSHNAAGDYSYLVRFHHDSSGPSLVAVYYPESDTDWAARMIAIDHGAEHPVLVHDYVGGETAFTGGRKAVVGLTLAMLQCPYDIEYGLEGDLDFSSVFWEVNAPHQKAAPTPHKP